LLEVGTGFHPELTGRENVFLNGSILGMGRREIKSQFDQIVDFSGIQQFINTPVKRYSSGMKVRLGFSVAAHLDLEILLIDEVLAVGDAEFQRKCMGKMDEVAHSGRTVLFVSHNMTAVQNLCPRAVLLEAGKLVMDGPSGDVVGKYLASFGTMASSRDLTDSSVERSGTGEAHLQNIELRSNSGKPVSAVSMGEGIRIKVEVCAKSVVRGVYSVFVLSDSRGDIITILHGNDNGDCRFDLDPGETVAVECVLPQMNLHPGLYAFTASLWHKGAMQAIDRVERAVSLEVLPADVFGTGKISNKAQKIFLTSKWKAMATNFSNDFFSGAENAESGSD
jgi:lipopolysaccharide transport system ATP-binding protein